MGRSGYMCLMMFILVDVYMGVPLNDNVVVDSSSVSKSPNSSSKMNLCDHWKAVLWQSDFHNCFMEKKYADGGEKLNTIVDRILEHAEACLAITSQGCQPTAKTFRNVFGKAIEQMRDYAHIYLEAILHERENIKDLRCVENSLSIENYEKCFSHVLNVSENEIEMSSEIDLQFVPLTEMKEGVEKGLICANNFNLHCSLEAKTSLNRMVRKLFGISNPVELVKTSTQSTKATSPVEVTETQTPNSKKIKEKPVEEPVEKTWAWYDYIIQPIISAWNWMSSLFG